jgi:hypothetical protein
MSTPERSDAPQPQPAPPATADSGGGWTFGRVVGLVSGSVVGLIGLVLLLGGLALVAVHAFGRDDDGYYSTGEERIESAGYAVTSGEIDLDVDEVDWFPEELLGTVRLTAQSERPRPIFLGIAPTADVSRYLADVGHAELTDFSDDRAEYRLHPGRSRPAPPADETFWERSAQGAGERVLNWEPEEGTWSVVLMNAGGERGVVADAEVATKVDWVIWAGLGLALVGALMVAGGVALIVILGRRATTAPRAPPA